MDQDLDRCPPFLVLAHHRSGSNYMNDLLQAHPCIECLNEPLSMHTSFFRARDLEPWSANEFEPQRLHASLTGEPELRDFLVEFRSYLLQSNAQRVIGFKETVLFGKLEWLKAFMPTLKIVFLTRDAREVVSSVLRSHLAGLWRYDDLVPAAYTRQFPGYHSPLGAGADPVLRATETAAMSIAVRHQTVRRALGLFEHEVLALDEVMREPHRCLATVSALLGVTPHPDQFSFLRERQLVSRGGTFSSFRARGEVEGRWRRDLSAAQLHVIDVVLRAAGHAAEWPLGDEPAA